MQPGYRSPHLPRISAAVVGWLTDPPPSGNLAAQVAGWDGEEWEAARWAIQVHGIGPLLDRAFESRPDGGARALLKAAATKPADHVFEIGCGSGAVAIALAARVPEGRVYAVDSNARAVECTRLGAEANGLAVEFTHDTYQFSFRQGANAWQPIGPALDAAMLSDEFATRFLNGFANSFGFTGNFIGIACQDLAGTRKTADFDYLSYEA